MKKKKFPIKINKRKIKIPLKQNKVASIYYKVQIINENNLQIKLIIKLFFKNIEH